MQDDVVPWCARTDNKAVMVLDTDNAVMVPLSPAAAEVYTQAFSTVPHS